MDVHLVKTLHLKVCLERDHARGGQKGKATYEKVQSSFVSAAMFNMETMKLLTKSRVSQVADKAG